MDGAVARMRRAGRRRGEPPRPALSSKGVRRPFAARCPRPVTARTIAGAAVMLTLAALPAAAAPAKESRAPSPPSLEEILALNTFGAATWSSDGRRLAFVVNHPDTAENSTQAEIWLWEAGADSARRLTRHRATGPEPDVLAGRRHARVRLDARHRRRREARDLHDVAARRRAVGVRHLRRRPVAKCSGRPTAAGSPTSRSTRCRSAVREWRKKKWDHDGRGRAPPVPAALGARDRDRQEAPAHHGRPVRLVRALVARLAARSPSSRARPAGPTTRTAATSRSSRSTAAMRTLGVIGSAFAWSPDGRWIALARRAPIAAREVQKSDLWIALRRRRREADRAHRRLRRRRRDAVLERRRPTRFYFHAAQGVTTRARRRLGRAARHVAARAPIVAAKPARRWRRATGRVAWVQCAAGPARRDPGGRSPAARRAARSRPPRRTSRGARLDPRRVVDEQRRHAGRGPAAPPAGRAPDARAQDAGAAPRRPLRRPRHDSASRRCGAVLRGARLPGVHAQLPLERRLRHRRSCCASAPTGAARTGATSRPASTAGARAGLADGNRLGVFGRSYGGYLSAWAITQTDRFDAAVRDRRRRRTCPRSTGRATSRSTARSSSRACRGRRPRTGRARSPIDVHRERADADADPRSATRTRACPLAAGAASSTRALEALGVPTEFVHYPREAHGAARVPAPARPCSSRMRPGSTGGSTDAARRPSRRARARGRIATDGERRGPQARRCCAGSRRAASRARAREVERLHEIAVLPAAPIPTTSACSPRSRACSRAFGAPRRSARATREAPRGQRASPAPRSDYPLLRAHRALAGRALAATTSRSTGTSSRTRTRLEALLPLLALPAESPAARRVRPRRCAAGSTGCGGRDETDAAFLVRRFARAARWTTPRARPLYDALDVPMRLAPGPGTPTRTLARALGLALPSLPARAAARARAPICARELPTSRRARARRSRPREGAALVDLARDGDGDARARPRRVRVRRPARRAARGLRRRPPVRGDRRACPSAGCCSKASTASSRSRTACRSATC